MSIPQISISLFIRKQFRKELATGVSTTIYGIEKGIPFQLPITEDQKVVSQYIKADDLKCKDVDLSYHMSKVMTEQIMAQHDLNKKIQTVALRFGPINTVFLGTSVSIDNATQALYLVDPQKRLTRPVVHYKQLKKVIHLTIKRRIFS